MPTSNPRPRPSAPPTRSAVTASHPLRQFNLGRRRLRDRHAPRISDAVTSGRVNLTTRPAPDNDFRPDWLFAAEPAHIGGLTLSEPTATATAVSLPSSFNTVMKTGDPAFTPAIFAGRKVTIGAVGGTMITCLPPL
jgi:hypothetical protein